MPGVRLKKDQLAWICDPAWIGFDTSDQIPDGPGTFGQNRARDAIEFAANMGRPGYNTAVVGEPGSGRHFLARRLLEKRAATEAPPDDWCYVNNFEDSTRPRVLRLPAGRGAGLKADMHRFAAELGSTMSSAFEAEEYRRHIEQIQNELKAREETALRELGASSLKEGIALISTAQGFVFTAVKNSEPLAPEEFQKLPEEDQRAISEKIEKFGTTLQEVLRQFPVWRRETQNRLRDVMRNTLGLAVGHIIDEIKEKFRDLPEVIAFLDQVLSDVIDSGPQARDGKEEEGSTISGVPAPFQKYEINLLVDRDGQKCAPVVYEDNPSYQNLIGRIDQVGHFGLLVTNFTMIRAGSLHRANGGYLLVDGEKLLAQPFAYDSLKRALKSSTIRIESPGQLLAGISTSPLEPDTIPLHVKVVLFCGRQLHYMLRELDPEFDELFKVAAEFESDVERTPETVSLYAQMLASLARSEKLRSFTREAFARIIEHSARLAGDANRLSARTRRLADLMRESDYFAGQAGRNSVDVQHVMRSLKEAEDRRGRIREAIQREILRDTIQIATDGATVGSINGLAVAIQGDAAFAHPVRITAAVWPGKGDIIDIERETELGGQIHSKGVFILSAFLASRFSRAKPLSFSASLVFEQSYGPVEGDSASLAELCVLISAISGVPIHQGIAMTGSVNQHGVAQAIGGASEKIEGFFDICKARGLTGSQGVIIPSSNIKHLMIRREIQEACEAGTFHIYAVDHVDDAVAILTQLEPGSADENGEFPANTVYGKLVSALDSMSRAGRRVRRQVQGSGSVDSGASDKK